MMTASQITRLVSIPSVLPLMASTSAVGAGFRQPPQDSPWVTPSDSPSTIPFMPSVITTAGMPSRATPRPLTIPQTTPSASASTIPIASLPFEPADCEMSTIAAAFRTHGTERSIPPIRITNVCPAATRPTNEEIWRICWIPLALANPGLTISPMMNRPIAATKP
jgi:hypothetical protein